MSNPASTPDTMPMTILFSRTTLRSICSESGFFEPLTGTNVFTASIIPFCWTFHFPLGGEPAEWKVESPAKWYDACGKDIGACQWLEKTGFRADTSQRRPAEQNRHGHLVGGARRVAHFGRA